MTVLILFLSLLVLILASIIAVHFFPNSWLGIKVRLAVVGTALFFLRHFLYLVKLIDDRWMPKKEKKADHKDLKFALTLIFLVLLILAGIAAMIYPVLSSFYMEKVQSQIQSQYQAEIIGSDQAMLDQLRKDANDYNRRLASGELSLLTPEENGYFDQLLVPGGSQIMGYIRIPKIQVDLPIFHGVATDTLDAGCGHMPQSSLPVGGKSTHAVISAHTGMASAPMFSDLPQLTVGDRFTIQILGKLLTYEILSEEDIRTVLPVEVQAVQIKNGQDLCTLVTCVPFGVNTHRLLVTGHRVTEEKVPVSPESILVPEEEISSSLWRAEYLKSLYMGFGVLGVILLIGAGAFLWFRFHKKGNYET